MSASDKVSSAPPSTRLGRGATAGVAAAKVGVKKAIYSGKRPFLNDTQKKLQDQAFDAEAARTLFDAASFMRGCALKLAQVAAMEMELLPETMRQELAKSYHQVPPLNRALIRKVISQELGRPESVFQRFDWRPFAAASLGQVHGAFSHDGTPLAVKIQYPGSADSVKADVALLQAALSPTRYGRIFSACIDLAGKKLEEELDYEREARQTNFFYLHLPEARFKIPEAVTALSTSRVLTTRKISGMHLDRWLETCPSRERRNHFGQALVDLMNLSIQHTGQLHADPNPGNFLFRDDGRLGVLDFGCVETLSPAFRSALQDLLWSPIVDVSLTAVEAQHAAIGIHYRQRRDIDSYSAFLDEWRNWLTEPYKNEFYDFGAHSDYFERGKRFLKYFYRYLDHYDGEFLYFGRTLHGIFRILHKLGARVRLRPEN